MDMQEVEFYLTDGGARQGQIQVSGVTHPETSDEAPVSVGKPGPDKGPVTLTFESGASVTMMDTHALWPSHQKKEQEPTFGKLRKLVQEGRIKVLCTVTALPRPGQGNTRTVSL